ncbi:YhgE/Pip domain-containing protein [Bacillus sp. FJAT-49736]|uniref:YhgE/Pip domain-containing protein n=1 Tax=Bacillus sp. FJAT-49736 TaxID=2833582 RepID=UPI001BC94F35|nr:YhgE/Pip domain-containing protein [Bacillus sp. FJAT-49736]MBS4175263.1 YhgE/Pip domain-containing protein [Bacillus sp. FJAT-49736]
MKHIMNIFFRDMKNIATNLAAAIMVLALILLPSLYAWFNIKASWDPYGNTYQIPVAIVNEDKGTRVRDKNIHAGNDLIESLKKNHSFEWHFVDRETAMKKVKYGDYYATILIPKDFSEKLGTGISDNPTKATVEYYVNEKINAIAPKITEKGASVLTEQISSSFISTVDGAIFNIFNTLGIEIQKNLPDIERFQQYLFLLEEKLPVIKTSLNESSGDINSALAIVKSAQQLIPNVKDATTKGLKTINDTTAFLNKAETRFNEISPKVKEDMEKVQKATHMVESFINSRQPISQDWGEVNNIQLETNDAIKHISDLQNLLVKWKKENRTTDNKAVRDKIAELQGILGSPSAQGNKNSEQLKGKLQQLDDLEASLSQNSDRRLDNSISTLDSVKQSLQEVQSNTDKLKAFISSMPNFEGVQNLTKTTSRQVDDFIKSYNNELEPMIRTRLKDAKDTLKEARDILVKIQHTIPQVESILSNTKEQLEKGKKVLDYANGEYPYVNYKVRKLADKVRSLNKQANITDLIQLLKNDPNAERGFFAEPVKLHTNTIFPIANYGTGMSPFYTVLALWVGGLLMVSLMTTDVNDMENYTGRQIYFGKGLTFLTIGVLQAFVVTAGDIWLLGVDVKEPFWFILFGFLSSLVFILIIYSLVSIFGNVGKALSIVLLVLQISSSGGTFPVVLLPKFFQQINPFLPFTYAVGLMREAVGGILWGKVLRDLPFLLLFGLIVIILVVLLKDPINRASNKLMEKAKQSGLFH